MDKLTPSELQVVENRHRLKVYEMQQRIKWAYLIQKPQKFKKEESKKLDIEG